MAWPENEAAQRTVFEPSSEDDDSNHRDTPLQCAMGNEPVSTTLEKVGEHMNGLTLQDSYLCAKLEAGSGYNNCRAEVHCGTEQHVYEDADKYLKYMQLVEFCVQIDLQLNYNHHRYPEGENYTEPDVYTSGKSVNGINVHCNT